MLTKSSAELSKKHKLVIVLILIFLISVILFTLYKKFSAEKSNKNNSQEAGLVLRTGEHYLNKNPDAKYTIVEYFNFDCIYCRRLHLSQEKQDADFSKVNYILRNLPINNNKISEQKSLVAECIYTQSGDAGYVKFLDNYYKSGKSEEGKSYIKEAEDLVKDKSELKSCISGNQKIKDDIKNNFLEDTLNGFGSTPTFVIYKNNEYAKTFYSIGPKLYPSLIKYYSDNKN